MEVHKTSLLSVFDAKQRLEIPLFQRQYVWSESQQWAPLWEDIERKFTEALEGRKDAPHHFLGAMVLDQKQTPTGHVVVRQVIDGQQRLTTLQIFLSSFRDFCRENDCAPLAAECDKFLFNSGMMANREVDQFKVWPTQLDRSQFKDIISAGSREEVLKRYPAKRKPYARKDDPRPRMVEAYLFFFDSLQTFFLSDSETPPIASDIPLPDRTEECFQALRNALMVVVIDLQSDDDPQVIFETLNARGEPLLPADLLRNYIFLRATREKLDVEAVYQKYWSRFDDEFWREEVSQGRLYRPRSDLFMQHFLASHRGQDIPIKHLYVEYRHWLEGTHPFPDVTSELATLARQGDDFRRIISPTPTDVTWRICTFLDVFDIRTAYPLLLAMMDAKLTTADWQEISVILESYLLRRALCNLSTKNYNRIFLSLTRTLKKDRFAPEHLRLALLAQSGDSGVWPDDTAFHEAWINKPQYEIMNNAKLVYLLGKLNNTFMSAKSEPIAFEKQPSIEHIMPQGWIDHWRFADGSAGMKWAELSQAPPDSIRAEHTRKRMALIQTLGNLTILTSELNSAQSNLPWTKKRAEMMAHSLLPINQALSGIAQWGDESIRERGEALYSRGLALWPR